MQRFAVLFQLRQALDKFLKHFVNLFSLAICLNIQTYRTVTAHQYLFREMTKTSQINHTHLNYPFPLKINIIIMDLNTQNNLFVRHYSLESHQLTNKTNLPRFKQYGTHEKQQIYF